MKRKNRILSVLMILVLLLVLAPAAFAERKPGPKDLEEINSGIEFPKEDEYLDEYVYAVVVAPHGHSVIGFGSADRLGSRYSVMNGERVKILAERKGVSCVIVLSENKGRWINSEYLVPENEGAYGEKEWVLLYEAYYYSGELESETEIIYNEEGRVVERVTRGVNRDGTETLQTTVFSYDEDNRISGTQTLDRETGETVEYAVWHFDENGRLQQILYYNDEGILLSEQINRYSDDGSTIEVIMYDDNGETRSRSVNYMNKDGNEYKYEYLYEYGMNFVREITYNSDGQKESGYEEGYGSKSTLRYVYDQNGVLIECIKTGESGYNTGRVTTTVYSYDERGNLTEELTLSDGEVMSRHVRKWGPPNGNG